MSTHHDPSTPVGRRVLLRGGLLTAGGLALGAAALPRTLAAQPGEVCGPPTEPNIEGPFHRPGAPFRERLRPAGAAGTGLVVSGRVMDTACRPMAGAVLDVWHADADGEYDDRGYRYRGQLRCDAQGRYHLRTIVPGRYLNGPTYRPAHVHVKVHADGRPRLTTQLYFPGDPYNDSDPWIRPSLILPARTARGGLAARFDFRV